MLRKRKRKRRMRKRLQTAPERRRSSRTPVIPGITNRTIGRLPAGTLVHPDTWIQSGKAMWSDITLYAPDDEGTYCVAEHDAEITNVLPALIICHIRQLSFKDKRGRRVYRRVTRLMSPMGIVHVSSCRRVGVDSGAFPRKRG